MVALAVLALVALAAWLGVLLHPARPWSFTPVCEDAPAPADPPGGAWPGVIAIVPARNEAAVLPEALPALLGQDYPGPLSVIVVDDGSEDGLEELLRDPPAGVRLIRQEHAGVSAARNHGARLARGEWLAFLDADDLWEHEMLELSLAALEATPEATWGFTLCSRMGPTGAIVPGGIDRVCPAFSVAGMAPEALLASALERGEVLVGGESVPLYQGDLYGLLFYGNFVLPSASVVRRDLYLRTGGYDEGLWCAVDTEFFHRVAAQAPAVVLPRPLVRYRTQQARALTSAPNAPTLARNALLSLERAQGLRPHLTDAEVTACRTGRLALLNRLAYTELSCLERARARHHQLQAWQEGAPVTPGSLAVLVGSLLPRPVLRGVHQGKRGWRRLVTATR